MDGQDGQDEDGVALLEPEAVAPGPVDVDALAQVIAGTEVCCALRAQAPSCVWRVSGTCLCSTTPGASASGSNRPWRIVVGFRRCVRPREPPGGLRRAWGGEVGRSDGAAALSTGFGEGGGNRRGAVNVQSRDRQER
jgi:hypothetical protein